MSHPDKLFASLFEPRRIALIGASADVTKTTSRPQRFLRKHGFAGEILPINPSRTEILGEKAYKDLDAVTGDIDHAYILLERQGRGRRARGLRQARREGGLDPGRRLRRCRRRRRLDAG